MHTFFSVCDIEVTLVNKGALITRVLKGVELTHPCSMHDAVALHLISEYTDLDAHIFDTPGSAARFFTSGEAGTVFGKHLERAFNGLCIVPPSATDALAALDSSVASFIGKSTEYADPSVDLCRLLEPGGVYFEEVRKAYESCIAHKVEL